jgi:hypothetical protein
MILYKVLIHMGSLTKTILSMLQMKKHENRKQTGSWTKTILSMPRMKKRKQHGHVDEDSFVDAANAAPMVTGRTHLYHTAYEFQ